MNKLIPTLFLILLCFGCKEPTRKADHNKQPDKEIASGLKHTFFFDNSLDTIAQLDWSQINVYTVNDEFDDWLEAELITKDKKWVKLELGNEHTVSTASFETNSNEFLQDAGYQVGEPVISYILKDSAEFNFDEGTPTLSIGTIQLKASCFKDLSDLELDNILVAREKKDASYLPEKLSGCKISSVRIVNIK